jgi:hypothetical protein
MYGILERFEKISDLRFEISNFKFQISDFRFEISNPNLPLSNPLTENHKVVQINNIVAVKITSRIITVCQPAVGE